ncbi:MAG: hypothetical protein DI537_05350 [Stutzerimonas stutzeri]|nr:MAG: hypothetical protein DI537_05350 [Stutzerimonas stutzeri]
MRHILIFAFAALASSTVYAGDNVQQPRRVATPTEVCNMITVAYRQALEGAPQIPATKNQLHDDLVSVSATISRHETLGRLLTIAWAQQCDLGDILTAERARISRIYPQLQAQ